jgi:hypothetical protein
MKSVFFILLLGVFATVESQDAEVRSHSVMPCR